MQHPLEYVKGLVSSKDQKSVNSSAVSNFFRQQTGVLLIMEAGDEALDGRCVFWHSDKNL